MIVETCIDRRHSENIFEIIKSNVMYIYSKMLAIINHVNDGRQKSYINQCDTTWWQLHIASYVGIENQFIAVI